MEHVSHAFYQMMEYPIPFNRDIFWYFWEWESLWGGVWFEISRAKLSEHIQTARRDYRFWWVVWMIVPFVEAVYITWSSSFNVWDAKEPLHIGVVLSRWRFWRWYLCVHVYVMLANIVQRIRWSTRVRIDRALSEQDTSLLSYRQGEYDVWSVYMVAHTSLRYQKYSSMPRSLYTTNSRICSYLPQHPLQSVISCGQELVSGKSRAWRYVEKIVGVFWLSWVWWLYRIVYIAYTMVRNIFRTKKTNIYAHKVRSIDQTRRQKLSLKRKVVTQHK